MGEAIITRRGGSGSGGYTPKIYVQTSQPTGKNGEFWVQDSGYSLDTIIADVIAPATLTTNALYLNLSVSTKRFQWLFNKKMAITSYVMYGQSYFNGFRNVPVYAYLNGWQNISKWSNSLFFKRRVNGLGEIDQATLNIIRTTDVDPTLYSSDIACTGSKIYVAGQNSVAMVDPESLATISTLSVSLSQLGGTSTKLFGTQGYTLHELDQNTLTSIHTSSIQVVWLDGMGDRLFATGYAIPEYYELDPDSLAIIRTGPRFKSISGLGGSSNSLYSLLFTEADNHTFLQQLDPNTFTTIRSTNMKFEVASISGTKN